MFNLTKETKAELKAGKNALAYAKVDIDLGTARNDKFMFWEGDYFSVVSVDAVNAVNIRLNNIRNPKIDLRYVREINSPFTQVFLSNTAEAGKTLSLLIGGDASFKAIPILPIKLVNTSSTDINPATEDKQDDVITKLTSIDDILGHSGILVGSLSQVDMGDDLAHHFADTHFVHDCIIKVLYNDAYLGSGASQTFPVVTNGSLSLPHLRTSDLYFKNKVPGSDCGIEYIALL